MSAVKNVGKKIVNTAKKVVKTVVNTVKNVARTVVNAVKQTAKTVRNAVTHTKTYQSVKNRVTSSGTYQKIVSKGSNFIRNVGSGLQKAGKTYTSFQSYAAERRAEIRAEVVRQMCTTADRISDQLGKVDWKKVGIAVVATGAAIGVGVLTGGVEHMEMLCLEEVVSYVLQVKMLRKQERNIIHLSNLMCQIEQRRFERMLNVNYARLQIEYLHL